MSHTGKAGICKTSQNAYCLQDSMVMCSFSRYGFDNERRFRFFEAITVWSFSQADTIRLADRIYTLERLFNIREGFTSKNDTLPWQSLNESMPDGPSKGNIVPLERMLAEYYKERGRDETSGIPKRETLQRLGIDHLAEKCPVVS
jgi:aldehyde:ferredoxin oxidoreductase